MVTRSQRFGGIHLMTPREGHALRLGAANRVGRNPCGPVDLFTVGTREVLRVYDARVARQPSREHSDTVGPSCDSSAGVDHERNARDGSSVGHARV